MLSLLRHRGPDEENAAFYRDGALICTRLRVMDPAPRALQPLHDERHQIAAVCNGEIYNFPELAGMLGRAGHSLTTTCDTEVLPHLYEEHGAEFPRHLRGMFGLAVLDTQQRRLLLARDRWGIKPLYVTRVRGPTGEYLAFSSELNALLASGVPRRPDRQAISDYAALGYIPAPETFYEHVYALQPGELLDARLMRDGSVRVRRSFYHRWTIAPDPSIRLATAVSECEGLLDRAVAAQSRADVPAGILLSGGIDSSLVAAMRSRRDTAVKAFSMRFADAGYDETWAARLTASHLGLHHTIVDLPPERGTFGHIVAVLAGMGQPFSDTSVFAVHALAEQVRRHVTVCLGGEGGDEAFGGYGVFGTFADGPDPAAAGSGESQLWASVESRHRLLDAAGHARLCQDDGLLPVRRFFEPTWSYVWPGPAAGPERLVAYTTEAATRLVLANDYLVKTDMAAMAHGLELRVPILDEDLFGYALTLPRALKATRARLKIVLRALAARMLPEAVAAKPKWGFSVPPYEWLGGGVRKEIAEVLRDPGSGLPEYFRPAEYVPWVAAFERGESLPDVDELYLFDRVIMLLALDLHLRAQPAGPTTGATLPL